MPKISVIIPVYNSERYLKQCLDSVINQSFKDIEIICINDGSTDKSVDILEEYAKKDKRIIIVNQENSFAGVARNKGIEIAKGDYIHFLDSDDWIKKNTYKYLYKKMSKYDVDVIFFQYEKFDIYSNLYTKNTRVLRKNNQISNFKENLCFFIYNPVVPWNKFYKRKFIIDNNLKFDDIISAEDRPFYIQTIIKAKKIMVSKKSLIYYRVNNINSLVGEIRLKNFECHFKSYETVKELCKELNEEEKSRIIDITMRDLLNFYHKSYGEYKKKIYNLIYEYFQIMDMMGCEERIKKFFWWNEYIAIKNGDINKAEKEFQKSKNNKKKKKRDFAYYKRKFLQHIRVHGIGYFIYIVFWFIAYRIKITNNMIKIFRKRPKKEHKIIVSLTSFPARVQTLHRCLKRILNQTMKPDMVVLWLANEQFPNREKDLPETILELRNDGLIIRWCDDLRPHKKYFYIMQEFPEAVIITVDDDILYENTLVEHLYSSYKKHPNAISCIKAHLINFNEFGNINPYEMWMREYYPLINKERMDLIPIGFGGVLYPPHILPNKTFNKKDIKKYCLNADDLWLKTMSLLNNIPVIVAKSPSFFYYKYIGNTQEEALKNNNLYKNGNNLALNNLLGKYNNYHGEKDTLINRMKKR